MTTTQRCVEPASPTPRLTPVVTTPSLTPVVTTPSLTSIATTPAHRRVALAVAIVLTLAAGLALPVAHRLGPVTPTFLPTWAILAVAADALTAYLFVGQFLCTRQPALAALAGTYPGLFMSISV